MSRLAPVLFAVASAACLALMPGCGDDSSNLPIVRDLAVPGPDIAMAPPDLTVGPDIAMPPDLGTALGIGRACPNGDADCPQGLLCLGAKLGFPSGGYCTKICNDTPDCGDGAFCGPPLDQKGTKACWALCGPGDTCGDPGRVCSRYLNGFVDLVNRACIPGNSKAVDGSACKSFGDCNKNQVCAANPYDTPDGYCATTHCTDDKSCTGNGYCLPGIQICLARCNVNGDCRTAENYACVPAPTGGDGGVVNVCILPHRDPSGPCSKNSDCGPVNTPWLCLQSKDVPGGYCTGQVPCNPNDDNSCPSNSRCATVTDMMGMHLNVCLASCDVKNDTCGTKHPGYTCKVFDVNQPPACLP